MVNIQQIIDTVKSFDDVVHGLTKSAFVPAAPPQGGAPMPPPGGGAPMDPSMMGGAPMPPQGAPMDPNMAGGMPPVDPNTGQPMPPQGAPMDPSMMGGAPPMDPSMAGGMPPQGGAPMPPQDGSAQLPADLMSKLQELAGSTGAMAENFDALQKQTDQLGAQQLSLSERLDKLEAILQGPAPYEGSSVASNPEAQEELEGKDLPLR